MLLDQSESTLLLQMCVLPHDFALVCKMGQLPDVPVEREEGRVDLWVPPMVLQLDEQRVRTRLLAQGNEVPRERWCGWSRRRWSQRGL